MLRDARLIAAKDLRVERRSRVSLTQVLPFALLVLMLFAFALDPDRGILERVTPGLFWITVLFSGLLAVQRSFAMEHADGILDGLRLSGIEPAGIFLGKVAAVALQMLVLEALLAVGVVVLYGTHLDGFALLVGTCLLATVGLAAAGSVYGMLSGGLRGRETLLPLLLLPVLAPLLVAATQATEAAITGVPGEGWRWLGLLAVFAAGYVVAGLALFDVLLEDG